LQDHVTQGLALTVLRPSVIFGEDDAFINVFAKLQALAPVVPLAGAHTRFQPVWVHDVAQAVAYAVLHPATTGHSYELAGPQVFTLQQLVEHAGIWAQHPRWVIPLPNALAYVQAWVIAYTLPGRSSTIRDRIKNEWPHKLNEIYFKLDRYVVDKSDTYDYNTYLSTPTWQNLPSSPKLETLDEKDFYVLFPRKTILPK
jgi:NADH dehydrogenase